MESPISLGLIGAGAVVKDYHLPALIGMSDFQLAWVCDKDRGRAEAIANAAGIKGVHSEISAAPDVDVVLVAVPVGARAEVLVTVFERGWHAFCEKPFAATLEQHRTFVAGARAAGTRLGVGLVRRQYSSTSTARRLLQAELLGPIEQVLAGEGSRVRRTGRDANWYQASAQASGGGVLWETGSHLVDQVFTLCAVGGYEIDACHQLAVDGLEFETKARGSLHLSGGRLVPFGFVVSRARDIYNGIVIRCGNGEVRVGIGPSSPVELCSRHSELIGSLPPLGARGTALVAAFQAQWRNFAHACQQSPAFSDVDTGLLTTAFIDECYRVNQAGALQVE